MANPSAPVATSVDLSTVDLTDPCAVAAALRRVYFQLVAGGQETKIKFRNQDVEEEVTFAAPNLSVLAQELARQDALCAMKTADGSVGALPARFCATAG